jgi:hypothetical protein
MEEREGSDRWRVLIGQDDGIGAVICQRKTLSLVSWKATLENQNGSRLNDVTPNP